MPKGGITPFPSDSGSAAGDLDSNILFTLRHKLTLAFAGIVLIAFIACTILFKWDVNEMAGIFIFIAIGVGLINKMSLVYGALIVGMARSITVILEDGKFLDTIVYGLATLLESLSPMAGAVGMFLGSADARRRRGQLYQSDLRGVDEHSRHQRNLLWQMAEVYAPVDCDMDGFVDCFRHDRCCDQLGTLLRNNKKAELLMGSPAFFACIAPS